MSCEILAPAGDEQSACAALLSGADAIYLGLTRFSARSSAQNFDLSALRRTVVFAHLLGAKVYVCLNTLVKDSETEDFFAALREAWNAGADAILMQDLFFGEKCKEIYPEVQLHLSTQAGCCNALGAELAREAGFQRVVLARETPLSEIEKISKIIETEVFVQGALCTCFSGQCYLSSFAGNNSGNRGQCKQPCRKRYSIDRFGYDSFAYALSTADLCVGERIKELQRAGVSSFKIEGRMRRKEYVAAAVAYYRALLNGRDGSEYFVDLQRAYNRGDYTTGLAFGQNHFLSRNVQGHIGQRVGFLDKDNFVKSEFSPQRGDGFKILRAGAEVGAAVLKRKEKDGFFLSSSSSPLKRGDEVRLTTDSSLEARQVKDRRRKIPLSLRFVAGEPARAECGEFCFLGPVLERAKSAPLTEEELKNCFEKTDSLPIEPFFERVETDGAFLQKSALNHFRRDFYGAFVERTVPQRRLPNREASAEIEIRSSEKRAYLSAGQAPAGILIYKPKDYSKLTEIPAQQGERFLYLPPFLTGEELSRIEPALSLFDGIYGEGYYALRFAQKHHKKFFAGTGFNLTNRFSVLKVKEAGAEYFALSKELDLSEQRALAAEGAFALSGGAIKVMDLVYCPFEKDCSHCDGREIYCLKDEEGRKFPLRRYRVGKACRFEVYNCASLVETTLPLGRLFDFTILSPMPLTRGHAERSML